MKIESVVAKYAELSAPKVSTITAVLSPDGWDDARCESEPDSHLKSEEIVEFTDVVTSFFHSCGTQKELNKFIRKYGTKTDAVTSVIRVDMCLMTYIIRMIGYAVSIEAYRKENV